MFIRKVKKQRSKDSNTFCQYSLVQSSRSDGKVKQRTVLYLGSDPLLESKVNRDKVLAVLKQKITGQQNIATEGIDKQLVDLALQYYEKYRIRYKLDEQKDTQKDDQSLDPVYIPTLPEQSDYQYVDINGVNTRDAKSFGPENLCRQVIDRLRLEDCFQQLGMKQDEVKKALISIAARAIYASSEHKTAQILEDNSELKACFNYHNDITHKQLYAVSDKLFKHKAHIDSFLYNRINDMFDNDDKLVIFDISNTYFETKKSKSSLAKHGKSKEKRYDCPLVVFTAVINKQGFIRHSRIYEGNKADTETLPDMMTDLAAHSPDGAKKTVVLDAGIATEENLALIREKGYDYVCVSRKRLKEYPVSDESNKVTRLTDRNKHQVELSIFKPKGYDDTWMYVQSEQKKVKEESMADKLKHRFEEDLKTVRNALSKKSGTKKTEKVWERIGRVKEKHKNISGRYEVKLKEKEGIATELTWKEKPNSVQTDKGKGIYFIRTSYNDPNEAQLWDIYNTIREVESTFRCMKTDLQIRPVHHQNDHRVEGHIYLTVLAYQLVNTIRYMLKNQNKHYDWSNIVRIMSTQTISTIELPTDKKLMHIRKPSRPIKEAQEIYQATECKETQKPIKKYVVYH